MISATSKLMASSLSRRRLLLQRLSRALPQEELSIFSITARRSLSTQPEAASSFAVVDHSAAYEEAMKGRHGGQLDLAELDAFGKDDPLFDPFVELELDSLDLGYEEETEDEDYDDEEDARIENKNNVEEAEFREIAADDVEEDDDDDDEVDQEDEEVDDDEEDEPDMYRNDGSLRYKKSQIAKFAAGAPAGGIFGVVELSGTQHKVTIDDVIVTEKLKPLSHYAVGTVHTFKDNILLVGSTHQTLVGMPLVNGAEMDVMVEEITQDAKVIIFKKRRKKNSQRKNGFRRDVTLLRVLDIRMPEGYDEHVHEPRVQPETY
mmetsp:Transcript_12613/g.21029  ORF Transcript_12613/g.21029 Transcript_12613/m.21029 type:complete len:319 (-) Transcript_12613:30-986(-)|eukprot:CAMPEP_0119015662 /NCGR_PEP_ID=MMETSP1176-20130426/11382_1 /TAXON_ID=265551 /ORGANISM="Synedropsis recta cf, Strain CCMP1620" /LENGTH=318 /DNA_ID=CAMNT_0006968973 /DNA_START=153 /DNA_END=1109 /DNA_ORIENTATION=+